MEEEEGVLALLPEELWIEIFSWIPAQQILSITSFVSKAWNRLSNNPFLWCALYRLQQFHKADDNTSVNLHWKLRYKRCCRYHLLLPTCVKLRSGNLIWDTKRGAVVQVRRTQISVPEIGTSIALSPPPHLASWTHRSLSKAILCERSTLDRDERLCHTRAIKRRALLGMQ